MITYNVFFQTWLIEINAILYVLYLSLIFSHKSYINTIQESIFFGQIFPSPNTLKLNMI